MNRVDRLYAVVEELRAAGPRGRNARRLAERFEVSVRTIERDILALQEAGVPISSQVGRRGGYLLDRSMTLPPLNFTPAEAVATAIGLRRPDQAIADAVVQAVENQAPIRIDYLDVGGRETVREIEPHQVVLGPNGSYVAGWCRLREDERWFRLDRIHTVEPRPGPFLQPVRDHGVEDYEARALTFE